MNFMAAVNAGSILPTFDWAVEGEGDMIRVNTVEAPTQVRMWQATNPDSLDFRLPTFGTNWTSTVLTDQGGGEYVGQVPAPATGGTAFFVELTYNVDGRTLIFTTEVSIVEPALSVTQTFSGLLRADDVVSFDIDVEAASNLDLMFDEKLQGTKYDPTIYVYSPERVLLHTVKKASSGTSIRLENLMQAGIYSVEIHEQRGKDDFGYSLTANVTPML